MGCFVYSELGDWMSKVDTVKIPLSFLFIKISRDDIWFFLHAKVNCVERLSEFKVSDRANLAKTV